MINAQYIASPWDYCKSVVLILEADIASETTKQTQGRRPPGDFVKPCVSPTITTCKRVNY